MDRVEVEIRGPAWKGGLEFIQAINGWYVVFDRIKTVVVDDEGHHMPPIAVFAHALQIFERHMAEEWARPRYDADGRLLP